MLENQVKVGDKKTKNAQPEILCSTLVDFRETSKSRDDAWRSATQWGVETPGKGKRAELKVKAEGDLDREVDNKKTNVATSKCRSMEGKELQEGETF